MDIDSYSSVRQITSRLSDDFANTWLVLEPSIEFVLLPTDQHDLLVLHAHMIAGTKGTGLEDQTHPPKLEA